jgi:hypothetical protein
MVNEKGVAGVMACHVRDRGGWTGQSNEIRAITIVDSR